MVSSQLHAKLCLMKLTQSNLLKLKVPKQLIVRLNSECRWCFTGTPLQNNLEDLYSFLWFLHVEPWCDAKWWQKLIQKPYENGDDRGLKLVIAILRPLMLRRNKETC